MGQKAITIQTPDWEVPHITADDDAFIYSSLAGTQSGILGNLQCARINANAVQISGGGVMNRGHILRIPADEVLKLTVDSETAGYERYDIVAAEFVKGSGETADSYEIKIVKGESSSTIPQAPTMVTSDLIDSGDVNQVALFKLWINGTSGPIVLETLSEKLQDINAERLVDQVYDRITQRTYQQSRAVRYGVKINKLESDPEARITYIYDAEGMTPAHMDYDNDIFDYGSWENAFFVSGNRPVMLRPDRTVAYELDPNDYSLKKSGAPSDADDESTTLNAMSEFPLIWLCQYEVDNYEYVIVSNVQYDETYRADAYTRADGTIAQYMYLPMFGGSYDGSRLRSISGQVLANNTDMQSEFNYAAANGAGWTVIPWCRRNLINCLLLIMGKSENSRVIFGRGNVNMSGVGSLNSGTLNNKGQFYGYRNTTHQVKIFHIEKWWGDRYDRIAGLISNNRRAKVKMSPPYNLTGSGYIDTLVDLPSVNGYQKDTRMTRYGRFPITTVDAGMSAYVCGYILVKSGAESPACVGSGYNDSTISSAPTLRFTKVTASYIGASISCESPIDAVIPEMYEGGKDAEAREELELLKSNFQVATTAEYQQAIGDDW